MSHLRLRLFLLWLRLTRPLVYKRLMRLWTYRLLEAVVSMEPFLTPLLSAAPKESTEEVVARWKTD